MNNKPFVVRESKENGNTKDNAELAKLRAFSIGKCKPTMPVTEPDDNMIYRNLTQILDYCATDIITEYTMYLCLFVCFGKWFCFSFSNQPKLLCN